MTNFDFDKNQDGRQYGCHLDNYGQSILVWEQYVGDQVKIPKLKIILQKISSSYVQKHFVH